MEIFGQIWNEGVVGSLTQALEWLNAGLVSVGLSSFLVSSWALTIILFTVIIKLLTLPLTLQQLRSQKAMQLVQPQLQALQKQYSKDREKLVQEQMKLYKEHNVNPMLGCVPMLVQMPVWIGLYSALFNLAGTMGESRFLWIASLSHPEVYNAAMPTAPPWELILALPPAIPVLAIVTGVTQWVTQKMMTPPSTDPQQQSMQAMMQFMPLMFVFFALSVPAGLVLYWVTSNVFMMVQQYFVNGGFKPVLATASASVSTAVPSRRSDAGLPASQRAGLSAAPDANGHLRDSAALEKAIPQAPPSARKRRRRNK